MSYGCVCPHAEHSSLCICLATSICVCVRLCSPSASACVHIGMCASVSACLCVHLRACVCVRASVFICIQNIKRSDANGSLRQDASCSRTFRTYYALLHSHDYCSVSLLHSRYEVIVCVNSICIVRYTDVHIDVHAFVTLCHDGCCLLPGVVQLWMCQLILYT